MIKDRYGVVFEEERSEFEKKYQLPFGYKLVTFNLEKAALKCRELGEGHVVEKISSSYGRINAREIVYRA
jgi:hypothetical protein